MTVFVPTMTFTIHLPTLILLSIALNCLIGFVLWWIYHLRGRQSCFILWAWACFTFAAGSLLAGARMVIDAPFITVFLAHSLLGLSPLLVLNGLQSFSRLPSRHHRQFTRITGIGFGVYLLLLLITFDQPLVTPNAITALFSALLFSVAVYRLSAIAPKVQMPVRVLQILFIAHGVLLLAQALVTTTNVLTGEVQGLELILRLMLINHILLATATALTLPLMAFSLSERRLRDLADRDNLTGLFNRRSFFREALRTFSKSRASGSTLALLMLDLDHFKQINDRWGHAAGDNALRLVARILESEVRDDDIIGRIGGEEFALVLPLSHGESLLNITKRLLDAISTQGLELQGNPIKLSASIGGIERNAGHKTFEDMMLDADAAMYTAKDKGRNRVELPGMPTRPATT